MRNTIKQTAHLSLVTAIGLLHLSFSPCAQSLDYKLADAAKEGDRNAVIDYLQRGANPNIYGPPNPPLNEAAGMGHANIVALLIKAGASVNRNACGRTPLKVACCHGHTNIAELLIQAGARVSTEHERRSLLDTALYHNHIATAKLFLPARATDEIQQLLNDAAQKGDVAVIDLLLQNGANTNGRYGGRSPLEFACCYDHADVVRQLVQAGADVNTRHNGWNPLEQALLNSHYDIVNLLRQAGAELTTHGLERASREGRVNAIKTLLQHDAPLPENYQSRPLLMWYAHLAHERAWHIEQALLATSYARLPNNLVILIRTMATDVKPRKPDLDSTDDTHRTVDELSSTESEPDYESDE